MQKETLVNGTKGALKEWHAIKWHKAFRMLKNLRGRIFRAAKEGNYKTLRSLQKLMLRSITNVIISVRRITQVNKGKGTAGIDGVTISSAAARAELINELRKYQPWKAKPARRIYIPKADGKKRPLGIPVIKDRVLQAMIVNALEPEWESKFEISSYGFRPGRGCHDAIEKVFGYSYSNANRRWVIDADIKGAFDMADADVLRRMMSGKDRSKKHLAEIEDKFFDNCKAFGYPEDTSREIWRQMESFAGYSFNKAHSASFAVESYQSLFLKTYYPLEFMVAVLNNYGGFYQNRRSVYVNEARKAGGIIHAPCVNHSVYGTTIYGKEIYLGFDCLLNINKKLAVLIPQERLLNGDYTGLENFVLRTGAGLDQMIILIRIGALRFTDFSKKELLWEVHMLLSGVKQEKENNLLFDAMSRKPVLPTLDHSLLEDLYDELELIGYTVSAPMFDLVKTSFRGDIPANDLHLKAGQTIRMVGEFVCDKDVRTKNGKWMKFGTFLDNQGDFFDTVHFPPQLAAYPLKGYGMYLIMGKVVLSFGCPSIEVQKIARLPLNPDPRSE